MTNNTEKIEETLEQIVRMRHDPEFVRRAAKAALAALSSAAAGPEVERVDSEHAAWRQRCITLSAHQLREALEYIAPDFDTDSVQREAKVSIAWAPENTVQDDEGGFGPAGYVCWMSDYPDEGCMPLSGTDDLERSFGNKPPDASAMLDFITMNRVAVVPEFEGCWDAELYGEAETVSRRGSGNTPRAAIRSLMDEEG